MSRPRLATPLGDLLIVGLVGVAIAAVLIGYLWVPFVGRPITQMHPSGPGWTCEYPPRGEPVCVKDVLGRAPKASP